MTVVWLLLKITVGMGIKKWSALESKTLGMLLYTALGSGTLHSLNPKAGVGNPEAEFKAAFWPWNTWLFWVKIISLIAGVQPQQDPGEPSGWMALVRERQCDKARGLSLKFIFAFPFYTRNNIFFGGSAYCLHTGHLKTLQQLDLQQKQDVTHIFFVHKSLSYHLAFRPANILWLEPGVT